MVTGDETISYFEFHSINPDACEQRAVEEGEGEPASLIHPVTGRGKQVFIMMGLHPWRATLHYREGGNPWKCADSIIDTA